MILQESAENYLEAILIRSLTGDKVRSVDIAADLGFSKPSVSFAMKRLREAGLVLMAEDGALSLTEAGRQTAESVYKRHRTLTDFLVLLGVDGETARADACRMEHFISELSFEKISEFTERNAKTDR